MQLELHFTHLFCSLKFLSSEVTYMSMCVDYIRWKYVSRCLIYLICSSFYYNRYYYIFNASVAQFQSKLFIRVRLSVRVTPDAPIFVAHSSTG